MTVDNQHRVTCPEGDTLADPHVILVGEPTPDGHEVLLRTDDLSHARACALAVSKDISRRLRDQLAAANRRAELLEVIASRLRGLVDVIDRGDHDTTSVGR